MIIGYLDTYEKNISIDNQKQAIEAYARSFSIAIDRFFSDNNIQNFTQNLKNTKHTLLLANILSLGVSLNLIKTNLKNLLNKGVRVISIKENLNIEASQEIDWLIKGMELSIDLRNSMVSTITKNALDNKKNNGCKLGREFGSKNKKKIWEGKEEEIKLKLSSGYSRKQTAAEVGISIVSLYNYLKQNPELKQTLAQS